MEEINNQNAENQCAVHGEYEGPGFWDAVKTCWKKYATFTGRARRSEFWYFQLFHFLVTLAAYLILVAVASIVTTCDLNWMVLFLFDALFFGTILTLAIPRWAVTCRRLHDIGKSGGWYGGFVVAAWVVVIFLHNLVLSSSGNMLFNSILTWMIFIGEMGYIFYLIILWCRDSDPKENQYGPSPKYY